MESSERVMTEGGDAEEEYVLRLRALLHDLVRKKGRIEAAKELGLDPRTVGACMDGEGMSWRVREALEMGLQEGAGSAAARQRKRNDALERRMEKLEKELHEGLDAVMGEIGKLRDDQDQKWESLERRLARRETQQDNRRESPRSAEDPSATGPTPEEAPSVAKPVGEGQVSEAAVPRTGDEGTRSRRRGGLRRGVAAHQRVAQAVEDPHRRGQGSGLAGDRGARPRTGGGHARRARADPATGEAAAARLVGGAPSSTGARRPSMRSAGRWPGGIC